MAILYSTASTSSVSRDTLDFDVLRSQIFLIVGITDLSLPADGLFIDTCRCGLGPGGESLGHVSEVMVSIQGKSNVSQGALSGFVIPELGIHQNPVMVKENVFFHLIPINYWPDGGEYPAHVTHPAAKDSPDPP